jgi:hypothetical protein
MGMEFNKTRADKGYVAALKLYQHRLNEYAGDLCDIMSPKDIMDKVLDIEKELKTHTSTGAGSGTPLDEVRYFLSESVN